MKKLISCILILTIFITSFTVSFADQSISKILLKENGKGKNFQVVNIKIDGKTVKSQDVPPIIYPLNNGARTLVPLRMIIEHFEDKLNAKIEWNQQRLEAKIETEQKEIILKIDSPIALVNGVEKNLPDNIPAKLLAIDDNGRTMVPIRFFAEELGLNVGWDEKTFTALIDFPENLNEQKEQLNDKKDTTVNDEEYIKEENISEVTDVKVKMNGNMPQIRIKVSERIDYNEFKLSNPERLVLDLNNAKFNLDNKDKLEINKTLDIKINSHVVERVRVSQFEKDPVYITRIVVELGNRADYEITFNNITKEIVIDFLNYIYDIKKEVTNAKEVVIIEGDFVEDYNILELRDPNRLVVDIKGAILHGGFRAKTLNIDGKVAKTIRVSQYEQGDKVSEEKVVRVVIDLNEHLDNFNSQEVYIEAENNKLKVHLEGEPFKSINYEETGWTTSKFMLKGSEVTTYHVDRQLTSNTIYITVPKTDIDLEPINLNVYDHILKTINIYEDRHNFNIELQLQNSVEYKLLSPEYGKDLILELNNKDAKYREILIIIDPGHGGSDPGTSSSTFNLKESEVVLDIALKFNQFLVDAGFRTYMTRVDNLNGNLKLSLQERVDIANALNADLFVSVHANSFTSSAINGIETFYSPSSASGKKLAQIFQTMLISDLGMTNRGAKPEKYYVLEHTTMPAVLVETGFLSNPSDESKLATDEYREQLAKTMFKAIVEYLESTK